MVELEPYRRRTIKFQKVMCKAGEEIGNAHGANIPSTTECNRHSSPSLFPLLRNSASCLTVPTAPHFAFRPRSPTRPAVMSVGSPGTAIITVMPAMPLTGANIPDNDFVVLESYLSITQADRGTLLDWNSYLSRVRSTDS